MLRDGTPAAVPSPARQALQAARLRRAARSVTEVKSWQ